MPLAGPTGGETHGRLVHNGIYNANEFLEFLDDIKVFYFLFITINKNKFYYWDSNKKFNSYIRIHGFNNKMFSTYNINTF